MRNSCVGPSSSPREAVKHGIHVFVPTSVVVVVVVVMVVGLAVVVVVVMGLGVGGVGGGVRWCAKLKPKEMRAWRPRSGPNSHQIDFLFDVQNFPRLHEASVARPDPSITFYLRRDWGCGRGRPVVRGQYCLRLGPASKTWLMVHTLSLIHI